MTFQKAGKKIIIRSFGLKYPEYHPKLPAPDAGILFYETDVRFASDPCEAAPEPGDVEEIYQAIIGRPAMRLFLSLESSVITQRVMQLIQGTNFTTLELNYFCYAGYHRSVAVARWAYELLRLNGRDKNPGQLELIHLTRAIRQAQLDARAI